jgi:hypothetical protein
MDEVFGYLPPVANPPSKRPLLTLLKQARAFGVGVCLATQNPVDLDYKALSNAGTWFIGRLQTDRDRARLLDGLADAGGAAGGTLDREAVDAAITGLGKRRFLVHSVHANGPVVIESRWALSYLRGPFTREDFKRLPSSTDSRPATPVATQPGPDKVDEAPVRRSPAVGLAEAGGRPMLPPDIPQFFAPAGAGTGPWLPSLYGAAEVTFADARRKVDETRFVALAVPLDASTVVVDWDSGVPTDLLPQHLSADAPAGGSFATIPAQAQQVKTFARWAKDLDRWLGRTQRLTLQRHPELGLVSQPGESERDFRIRLASASREARDKAVDALRSKYASKLKSATEKVRKAEMALGKERQDVSQHKVQTGLSAASAIGAAALGAIFGRRGGLTAGTIGKASTAAKGWARGSKEDEDVQRAQQNLQVAREALASLEREIESAIAAAGGDDALETITVAPRRGGIHVQLVAIVWTRT